MAPVLREYIVVLGAESSDGKGFSRQFKLHLPEAWSPQQVTLHMQEALEIFERVVEETKRS